MKAKKTKKNEPFWKIGSNYFIRTATYHHTGKLVSLTPTEILITHAAWIADSGRFTQALRSCDFMEVEMFPADAIVCINRLSMIDAVIIAKLPSGQK